MCRIIYCKRTSSNFCIRTIQSPNVLMSLIETRYLYVIGCHVSGSCLVCCMHHLPAFWYVHTHSLLHLKLGSLPLPISAATATTDTHACWPPGFHSEIDRDVSFRGRGGDRGGGEVVQYMLNLVQCGVCLASVGESGWLKFWEIP